MKIEALSVTLLMVANASAIDVHFEVPASGYVFDAATGGATSDSITGQTRFLFRGHARAASAQIVFRAETVKGVLVSPNGSKRPILKHADTVGAATVTRKVATGSGTQATTIRGSRFVFDGDLKNGHLQVSGPVDIVDGGGGKSDVHMTGKNGAVDLDMSQTNVQNAFRKGKLDGSVSVDIAGVKNGGKIHATGDQLVFDNSAAPATIVLTGHVSISGQGSNFVGSAPNLNRVKFLLNRQGQWTHLNVGEDLD